MTLATYEELRAQGERAARMGVTQCGGTTAQEGVLTRLGDMRAELEHQMPLVVIAHGWAAEWHRLAWPTVTMGHRYAAALLSTAAPEWEIRSPWSHFLIMVPDHLIELVNRDGESDSVGRVLVMSSHGDRWTWLALAERCEYSMIGTTTDHMRRGEREVPHPWAEPFGHLPTTTQDERAVVLIDRLVLNACAVLTGDPSQVRPVGKRRPAGPHAGAAALGGGTYELRRDVRVDCRAAVRDYLLGARRTAPAVRWIVRGHWRQQPHGADRALRRSQWIEPFWKGADDAPVAMRAHDLRAVPGEKR
jgi:hypothetical protein